MGYSIETLYSGGCNHEGAIWQPAGCLRVNNERPRNLYETLTEMIDILVLNKPNKMKEPKTNP